MRLLKEWSDELSMPRTTETKAGRREGWAPASTVTPHTRAASLTAHRQRLTPPLGPVGLGWKGKGQSGTTQEPHGPTPSPAPCLPDVFVDLQQHLVVLEIRVPPAVGVGVEWLWEENKLLGQASRELQSQVGFEA